MKTPTLALFLLAATAGVAVGIGAFTFVYAKGGSYLVNDPAACANCHVMQEHYDGWIKSSHRSVATCNDCHTPESLIPKYYVKAENGFWHSFYFTTGDFPDNLNARDKSLRITEGACRRCHTDIAEDLGGPHGLTVESSEVTCIKCHSTVGHP